jgi:hypothetical protein
MERSVVSVVKSSSAVKSLVSTPDPDTVMALIDRITAGESFWVVVHDPLMSRDITRADVREVISWGLEKTLGNYTRTCQVFNMTQPPDYKRLLNFLRKYDCELPFRTFRIVPTTKPTSQ